jgi:isopentenyldiphosphate isomerase
MSEWIVLADPSGRIVGGEERWKVHREGLLHFGFSVALFYRGKVLVQWRRHRAFDGVVDLTASGHPLWLGEGPQDEREAARQCLRREWDLDLDREALVPLDRFCYRAADGRGFVEHEWCTIYGARIRHLPTPREEFAYGFELIEPELLHAWSRETPLAPWVQHALGRLNFVEIGRCL